MISIDIDGPSTMLNSICESIVITQGSVYSHNTPKPPPAGKPIAQSIRKSIFDQDLSQSSSRLRHVVLDQHEEYLLDTTRTPTPSTKKEKIEVIDTWQDHTVIEGSSTAWRSPSIKSHTATKHTQPTGAAQNFLSGIEPSIVHTRIAPSHDVKHHASEQMDIPTVFDWNTSNINTPTKVQKTTRDIALSPIIVSKHFQSMSTSPIHFPGKVDRACQYSPPATHELAIQYHVPNIPASTQVAAYDLPRFLITDGGTQTTNDESTRLRPSFDDSGIHARPQTVSPSLSAASSEAQPTTQPFTLSGSDFVSKHNEQRHKASPLTVTQYNNGHHYLPLNDHDQTAMHGRTATLERSADSGILVDDPQVCLSLLSSQTLNPLLPIPVSTQSSSHRKLRPPSRHQRFVVRQ